MAEGLKLKVRKFWGLVCAFGKVSGEKLVGGPFWVNDFDHPVATGSQQLDINDFNKLKIKDNSSISILQRNIFSLLKQYRFEELVIFIK